MLSKFESLTATHLIKKKKKTLLKHYFFFNISISRDFENIVVEEVQDFIEYCINKYKELFVILVIMFSYITRNAPLYYFF